MPVESRTLPVYFHTVPTKAYRENFDRIFGKKSKPTVTVETVTDEQPKRKPGRPKGSTNKVTPDTNEPF